MGNLFEGHSRTWLRWSVLAVVILLAVFLLVEAVMAFMGLRYIGTGVAATNTITVSGHGEIFATPDIATFSWSVVADKATVSDAQAAATAAANQVTSFLAAQGVATSDIQTTDYSINPTYQYESAGCPINPLDGGAVSSGCTSGKQVLTGYEVNQTDTVKVRTISNAGTLLAGVGTNGATNVSGLTFTFDNPDAVQDQARTAAINDAKQKAQTLASELGVSLVRVTSFTENTGGANPQPVVYSMAAGATASPASSPEISTGQNDITDDVTITYEIR